MKKNWPYTITHHSLDASILMPELAGKDRGNYFVFWWRSVALGQLFLEPNEVISEEKFYHQLIQAIAPTIDFYTSGTPSYQWEQALKTKDFNAWKNWMDSVFTSHTSSAVPAQVPVSVVICTRNRAKHLHLCLERLQMLTCFPTEIIVVDNAPTDESSKEVTMGFKEVTYVREPRAGLDIARNTGIRKANCPIVAYLDDDVVVHPLWVYRVWETFQEENTAAMTGLVIASELETEAQQIFERHWSFNRGYLDKVYDTHFFNSGLSQGPPVWDIGAGANMAFRKSVFAKVGYFDEILDVGAAGCNGDSEMWYRILAHGYTIRYNPRAVAYHEHRRDLKGLRKQIFYYMRGFTTAALLQQQQYPLADYKKLLFHVIPKHYYLLVIRGFPRYRDRNRTLWSEMTGILSGFAFYRKNREKSTVDRAELSSIKPVPDLDLHPTLQ
ncbi:glycosyltransferase family 2 protein [Sabulibacter ruber]|uniref:glycosyltransferase family 2 protein n=1 Tax=Sabulibacter ruber TaxID=2811901 RepID=UPI001A957B51|nr:glycosyltransferase [Sabulibacter ruber]